VVGQYVSPTSWFGAAVHIIGQCRGCHKVNLPTCKGNLNDDSELLGVVKRVLAAQSQAVPADVALAASADDALFATLCFLVANQHLRLLSVWSPTFALQLLEAIPVWADEIIDVLS
jgi:hypothetical protein